MNLGKGIWKSIRPLNLLIIALTFYSMRFVVHAIPRFFDEHIAMSEGLYFFLCLSILLLAAGGNVINDLEDIEVDEHNRPGTNPVPALIKKENAWSVYVLFTLSGLLLGMISLLFLSAFHLWFFHVFIAGSLWFYSRDMQKQPLIGNFVVALLCGLIPVLVLLYEQSCSPLSFVAIYGLIFYALQAFLLTFMRELVKDVEDMEGDALLGYRTFPIAAGIFWTQVLVVSIGLLAMILNAQMLYELHLLTHDKTIIYLMAALFYLPLLRVIISVMRAASKDSYARIADYLKWSLLAGLGTSVFFHFL